MSFTNWVTQIRENVLGGEKIKIFATNDIDGIMSMKIIKFFIDSIVPKKKKKYDFLLIDHPCKIVDILEMQQKIQFSIILINISQYLQENRIYETLRNTLKNSIIEINGLVKIRNNSVDEITNDFELEKHVPSAYQIFRALYFSNYEEFEKLEKDAKLGTINGLLVSLMNDYVNQNMSNSEYSKIMNLLSNYPKKSKLKSKVFSLLGIKKQVCFNIKCYRYEKNFLQSLENSYPFISNETKLSWNSSEGKSFREELFQTLAKKGISKESLSRKFENIHPSITSELLKIFLSGKPKSLESIFQNLVINDFETQNHSKNKKLYIRDILECISTFVNFHFLDERQKSENSGYSDILELLNDLDDFLIYFTADVINEEIKTVCGISKATAEFFKSCLISDNFVEKNGFRYLVVPKYPKIYSTENSNFYGFLCLSRILRFVNEDHKSPLILVIDDIYSVEDEKKIYIYGPIGSCEMKNYCSIEIISFFRKLSASSSSTKEQSEDHQNHENDVKTELLCFFNMFLVIKECEDKEVKKDMESLVQHLSIHRTPPRQISKISQNLEDEEDDEISKTLDFETPFFSSPEGGFKSKKEHEHRNFVDNEVRARELRREIGVGKRKPRHRSNRGMGLDSSAKFVVPPVKRKYKGKYGSKVGLEIFSESPSEVGNPRKRRKIDKE